jgi:elongation factor Tu
VDHGKTTLTAALTKVGAERFGGEFKAYDQIDAARKKARGITISTAHVDYGANRHYAWTARTYTSEHDHGCRADGRRDPGVLGRRRLMPQTREHILLAPGGRAVRGVYMNKCDMVDDAELLELVDMGA